MNQRSVPPIADTLGSARRSWRTVETPRRDADSLGIRGNDKRFADDVAGSDLDHWRENAGKVCVQGAAAVRRVAVMLMLMGICPVSVIVPMLMMTM
jgi:hypothetical protein